MTPPPDASDIDLALDTSPVVSMPGLGDAWRGYVARVKSGDMGSLPAWLAFVILVFLFRALSPFFLTKLNVANLFVQSAELMVLAMAVSYLIILTEIDLSAGTTGGVALAAFIILVSRHGVGWPLALLVGLAIGVATGLVLGFFVAKVGIPAFVLSLGFFLGFQGLMLVLLGDGGIFRVETKPILKIMNGNMAPWAGWVLVAVMIALAIVLAMWDRARRRTAELPAVPIGVAAVKIGMLALAGVIIVGFLNVNRSASIKPIRGVPIVVPIVLAILFVGTFVLERTRFGLHFYAVGGNPEAARRAGINTARIRISGFVICSCLAVISGVLHASRIGVVEATAGRQIVLSGVGAAVVGGVSLFGGRGRMSNAAIGAVVIAMIDNGLGLLGLKAGISFLVTGGVLVLATSVDALSRRRNSTAAARR